MTSELFVDGILGVAFGKGAVRVDFFTLSPDAVDAKGQPVRERSQRVVMTTEVFMESVAMLQGIKDKIEAQGLIAHRHPKKDGPGGPAPGRAKKDESPSPNF
jgi:hypothetical protein